MVALWLLNETLRSPETGEVIDPLELQWELHLFLFVDSDCCLLTE